MTGDRASADRVRHGRVRIPADVEREDRILAGLTARQLALLAAPGVLLWAAYLGSRRWVPAPVFAAVALPIAVAVVTLVLGRRDGLSLDRLAAAWARQARGPRRLVPAPDGVPQPPDWAGRDRQPRPAVLRLPARHLTGDGIIDLGADGTAILCRASAVSFALRTPVEQQALIAAFGRYLNGLTIDVQVLVRSEPIDLTATIGDLHDRAGGLPHPALERAARAHAAFLTELTEQRDLLTRQVLLVFHDPDSGDSAAERLQRIAADAKAALSVAGITVTVLDGPAASAVFARAADPWAPTRPAGLAPPDEIITGTAPGVRS
ncbi:MAG: PrgI family protein [Actinomycetes bacterium]